MLGAQERPGELDIMKTFKTDCAAAFITETFTILVQRKGIKIEHSTLYTHHQNGITERTMKTIREIGFSQSNVTFESSQVLMAIRNETCSVFEPTFFEKRQHLFLKCSTSYQMKDNSNSGAVMRLLSHA